MNEQWNNALDQVSDEYLLEAARYRKKRYWPGVVGAAAAVLALAIGWSFLRPGPSTEPKLAAPVDHTTVASGDTSGSSAAPGDGRGDSTNLPTTNTAPANPSGTSPNHFAGDSSAHAPRHFLEQFWDDLWDCIWDFFRGEDEDTTPPPTTEAPEPIDRFVDDEPDDYWNYYSGTSYEELQTDYLDGWDPCLNLEMRLPFFGGQPPEFHLISVYDHDIGGVPWAWYWTSFEPHFSIRVAQYYEDFSADCTGTEAMYQLCPDAPNLHNRETYSEYYSQIQEVTVTTYDGEKTALLQHSTHLDRYFLNFVQNGCLVTIAGDQSILEPEWLSNFHLVPLGDLDKFKRQTQQQQANELFCANPWEAAKEYSQYFRVICARETRYTVSGQAYKTFENEYDAQTNTLITRYYGSDGELQTCTKEQYDQNGNLIRQVEDHGTWGYDTLWDYDENGLKLCETRLKSDGSMESKTVYEYDKYGNRSLLIRFDAEQNVTSAYEYQYNYNGHCSKVIRYGADYVLENTTAYRYDWYGNQSEIMYYDANDCLTSSSEAEYDEDGNLLRQSFYDSNGNLTGKTEYEYDGKGNTICNEYKDGKLVNHSIQTYIQEGNTTYSSEYKNGELVNGDVCTYDEQGNQIQYDRHYPISEMDYTYKMKRDENGNKILQEEYDRDGNLVGWIEYEGYQVICLASVAG